MTSFYDFYEQVQLSKLKESVEVLLEMPMRPVGSADQYANRNVSPFARTTSTDGYTGTTAKGLVDKGAKIDREIDADNWEKAVEERPELGVHSQVNDELAKERALSRAQDKQLGLDTSKEGERSRSGRMIQTNKTDEPQDVEAVASQNRGLSNLINKIEELKSKMAQASKNADPSTDEISQELFQALTIFQKHGRLTGPIADNYNQLLQKLAEIKNKKDVEQHGDWRDL